MDVRFLLLLVCLCTLSFPSSVMALQRDASTLDTATVESVHYRTSHGPYNQEESRHEGLIAVYHSEIVSIQLGTPGLARRLLSHGDRQFLAKKVQDDKDQPKNKVDKHDSTSEKGSSADAKPLGDTGHEASTDNEAKSGGKERDIAPSPPPKPEESPPTVSKEKEFNNTIPNGEKPDNQVKDDHPPPEKKPNVPTMQCGGSQCEDAKKSVSACLRIPGDGAHQLSLFIQNGGDSEVLVKVVAPEYLTADPPEVSVLKGKSETIQLRMDSKFEPSRLDSEAVKNENITVIAASAECTIAVPLDYLLSSVTEQNPSLSYYLASVTPRVVAYLVAIVLVVALVGAWLCYKCCRKKRGGDVKYQQLEMIVPGQSTPKDRVEQSTGAWDDVWDDDWEDSEAAKSTSRLTQNLSARGLGARRGNKDGWDTSWED